LVLTESILSSDQKWTIKSFAASHQFSTGEIEPVEPEEIEELIGATCVVQP
jgi:hypothetical protein